MNLLIHVFLIKFRQGNVKLVLLKEFKPIILEFASENKFMICGKQYFPVWKRISAMNVLLNLPGYIDRN
jgi:hypothetical protein